MQDPSDALPPQNLLIWFDTSGVAASQVVKATTLSRPFMKLLKKCAPV